MRLRTLVLATTCASGCVLGGASAEPTGSYEAVWTDASLGNPESWCRAGWIVEARARPMASVLSNPDDDLRDWFPCAQPSGVSAPIPVGAYQITLTLFDAGGVQLASEGPAPVEVSAGFVTSAGVFRFTLP